MKYTAGGESRVANVAQGEARVLYLSRHPVYFIQTILSVLLYFTPTDV